jgi:hypothetical protein
MLFALRQPATLLGLVLGFAVGCFLRVTLQQLIVGGRNSSRSTGRALRAPMTWLDPFGLVGALLAGIGWSPRPVLNRSKPRQVWAMVVVAVGVHAALAAIGLAAYVAAGGLRIAIPFASTISVLHGTQVIATTFAEKVALGFGVENLGCGLLALVPIPPLELGVALWSTLPKSPGSRRIAYRVLDEQWGIGIVLVLLLLPLAAEQPALLQLVGTVGDRILRAV